MAVSKIKLINKGISKSFNDNETFVVGVPNNRTILFAFSHPYSSSYSCGLYLASSGFTATGHINAIKESSDISISKTGINQFTITCQHGGTMSMLWG